VENPEKTLILTISINELIKNNKILYSTVVNIFNLFFLISFCDVLLLCN